MQAATGLRGGAVVVRDNPAELRFPFDLALVRWSKINIKNIVVDLLTLVGSREVVVREPLPVDIIEVVNAQADKVVETLLFYGRNIGLRVSVWRCNQLHLMGNLKHKLFV